MLTRIRSILEPTLSDPEEARRQYLLNLVLLALGVPGFLFGVAGLILWLLGLAPSTGAIAGLGVQGFYLAAYWLARKGKVGLASFLPIAAVFLAMVGGGFYVGLGHANYIGFAMVALTAGILIGAKAGYLSALLSAVAYFAIGFYQNRGGIPTAIPPETSLLADIAALFFGLIVMAAFTQIYTGQLRQALTNEQALSAALKVREQNLEAEVQRRTRSLERRATLIRTSAEISSHIASIRDPQALLESTVELLRERFNLYYVGIFLLDERGEFAILRAGSGEAGKLMLAERYRLAVGGKSMIGWATANRQPRIALDVGEEKVRFANPYLPLTRSELAIPMLSREKVVGAITVQSDQPDAFDENDIIAFQGIADALTIALENARLLEESRRTLRELERLYGERAQEAWRERMAQTTVAYRYTGLGVEPAPLSAIRRGEGDSQGTDASRQLTVPISLRGQTIGTIVLRRDPEVAPWSPDEADLAQEIGGQVALALENARLLDETRRRAARDQMLAEITARVRETLDLETMLRTAAEKMREALSLPEMVIRLTMKDSELR